MNKRVLLILIPILMLGIIVGLSSQFSGRAAPAIVISTNPAGNLGPVFAGQTNTQTLISVVVTGLTAGQSIQVNVTRSTAPPVGVTTSFLNATGSHPVFVLLNLTDTIPSNHIGLRLDASASAAVGNYTTTITGFGTPTGGVQTSGKGSVNLIVGGTVCLGDPATGAGGGAPGLSNPCITSAGASQPGYTFRTPTATPTPTQVRVGVFIQHSDALNSFDISIQAPHMLLPAIGVDVTGTILPGGAGGVSTVVECLNLRLIKGTGCPNSDTVDTLHYAATGAFGLVTSPPTTGLLFTAIYNVTATTAQPILLGFNTGCSQSSESGTPIICVTIGNGTHVAVPETINPTTTTSVGTVSVQASLVPFFTATSSGITPNPATIGSVFSASVTYSPHAFPTTGTHTVSFSAVTNSPNFMVSAPGTLTCTANTNCVATISSISATAAGNYTVTVYGTYASVVSGKTTTLVITITLGVSIQDLGLSASPGTIDIAPLQSFDAMTTLTSLNGWTGTAVLTPLISPGPPTNVTIGFFSAANPATCGFHNSTCTVNIPANGIVPIVTTIASNVTAPGAFNIWTIGISVTGTSTAGSSSPSTLITAYVNDFVLSNTPVSFTTTQGSGSTTLSVDSLPSGNAISGSYPFGVTGFMNFSATVAPSTGLTVTLPANGTFVVNPGVTNTGQITFTSNTAGTYAVTMRAVGGITGQAAQIVHTLVITVQVTGGVHTTTTFVSCTTPVIVGQGSTCTVNVNDPNTGPTTPTGTATLTSTVAGTFTTCTLAQVGTTVGSASCISTYTPSAAGSASVNATYPGDTKHSRSSALTTVVVNLRPTTTTVSCTPSTVVVAQGSVCTATVVDADAGSVSTPAGTVAFTFSGTAAGGFAGSPCTLAQGTNPVGTASCTATFAGTSAGSASVSASYTQATTDTTHANSATTVATSITVTLRPTTTTISCTPPTIIVGQGSICTATVIDPATNPGTVSTPAGSVAFTPSGTATGSFGTGSPCTLAQGTNPVGTASCSATFVPNHPGSATVNAAYTASDTAHATSSSATAASITVNLRPTTTTVSCAPSTVNFAGTSTCTATVVDGPSNAGTVSTPTGSVAFAITGTATGSSFGTSTPCTLAQGTNPVGTASCTATFTAGSTAGAANIVGTYSPAISDTAHMGSTSTSFPITVTAGNVPVVSTPALSPNPALVGQQISVTFTVTSTTTVTQVTVNWGDGTTDTLAGSATSDTHTYASSSGPTFTVVVTATNAAGPGSNSATETVNLRPTTTTVSCSPSTVIVAQGSVCTATVVDPATNAGIVSTPAGTVSFTFSGTAAGGFTGSPCTLAQGANPVGTASCAATFTGTSAGSASVSASYAHATTDTAHANSVSATASTITIGLRPTTTTVSCTPSAVIVAQGSVCTATVVDPATNAGAVSSPAGTVTFTVTGTATGSFGTTSPCTLAQGTNPAGTTTCTATFTPTQAGSASVSASYGPTDSAHTVSSSATTAAVTVNLRPTTTTVSCIPSSVAVAGTSTCTATVVDPASNSGTTSTPAGTVAFTITGTAIGSSFGTTTPCTLAQGTNPVGTASCNATFTAGSTAGTANIVGTFSPAATDVAHATSTSVAFSITVTAGNVPVVSTPALSPNPALVGQQVTATFTVTSSTTVTQVTVNWGDGVTDTLSGTATSDMHTYSGASTFTVVVTATNAAGPGTNSAQEMVNLRPTTTSVLCTPSTVLVAQSSTCTATVVDPATNAGSVTTPAGTVAFSPAGNFGTSTPCTLAQGANPVGTASCTATLASSSTGGLGVSGVFTPSTADTAHASSTSAPLTVTVNLRPTTTTVLCAPSSVTTGGTSICTATVVDPATNPGTASTPAGTVAFAITGTAIGSSFGTTTPCTLAQGTNPVGTAGCTATFTAGSTAGTANIAVTYSPSTADTAHSGSSGTASITVNSGADTTSTLVNCAPSSITVGASTVCTATVTDTATTGATNPGGTVTFSNGGASGAFTPANAVCTLSNLGTNQATCPVSYSPTAVGAGTQSIGAVYGGDSGHSGSTAQNFALTVNMASPTLTTLLSSNSISVGNTVSDSATLASSFQAVGSVTYSVFTNNICTAPGMIASIVTVTGGVVPNSRLVTFNSTGDFGFQASYSGDANNNGVMSSCEPLTVSTNVSIRTSLSSASITVGGSVTDSATLAGQSTTAGGTVIYTSFANGACAAPGRIVSNVTVVNGVVPDSKGVIFNSTGTFSFQAAYSGDANNNAAISACESLTVTQPGGQPVLLTFQGFDIDDFENGVGQLQVLVNGHLVVDIPAGLNHLSGSGDYAPYTNTLVNFGPFDITSFVINGQNNVTFTDPLTSHFGLVKNVTIVQGSQKLLNVRHAAPVFPGHSVTYTFSIPPLVITSITADLSPPVVDQTVTFTASFTGGTAPFTCVFRFGDGESASVPATGGQCSVTHDYDYSGTFLVTVIVKGASTSDLVSAHTTVTVA